MLPVMAITDAGESKAWERLAASDPATVSGRAAVGFDPASGCYRLASFGRHFTVHPGDRRILNLEPEGEAFLKRDEYFFRLTVLWYLVKASPARPSGTLVNPAALPGGEIFLRGTHVLPLDALAANYARRPEAFLAAGAALGGKSAPRRRRGRALPAAEGASDGYPVDRGRRIPGAGGSALRRDVHEPPAARRPLVDRDAHGAVLAGIGDYSPRRAAPAGRRRHPDLDQECGTERTGAGANTLHGNLRDEHTIESKIALSELME